MTKKLTHYTREQKSEAAIQYAIKGVMSKVSRDLDIPEPTLCGWKETDWWDKLIEEVRSQKSDEHIARYQSLTTKALKAAGKGIKDLEGTKLSAGDIKALIVAGATCTDKARLLLNQPTSIKADSSSQQSMLKFLEQISDTYREKNKNVVSVQDKE